MLNFFGPEDSLDRISASEKPYFTEAETEEKNRIIFLPYVANFSIYEKKVKLSDGT